MTVRKQKRYAFPKAGNREITYSINTLAQGEHTAVIKVMSGTYSVDEFEIYGAAKQQKAADSSADKSSSAAESKSRIKKGIVIGAVSAAAALTAAGAVYIIRKKKK